MQRQNVALLGIGAIGSVIFSQLVKNEQLNITCFNRSQKEKIELEYDNDILTYVIDSQFVVKGSRKTIRKFDFSQN